MILDTKLGDLKNIISKINKTIGLLRKLKNILPRASILTIFKSFVKPHVDYGAVTYTKIIIIFFIRERSQDNIT